MAKADPGFTAPAYPPIADAIGRFAVELAWHKIPASTQDRAKLLILDALGVAIAANRYPFASKIRSALADLAAVDGSRGRSGLIGSSEKLPLRDAVVMNGALIHGIDFDDTHVASVVHATAVALPVVLSVGELVEAEGTELLSAYLAAMETAIRIGITANFGFHDKGLHATGVAGHFSSAVGAGRLFGLTANEIATAQGIVGSTAMASQEFVGEGAWNKRFHPGWAAVAGITAAKLAQGGFVAPARAYEGRFGLFRSLLGTDPGAFDISQMTRGLGTTWETERAAIKPFPTCHFTHAPADCALFLAREHDIDPEAVERITVSIPEPTIQVVAEPRETKLKPVSDYDGKFSVQYIVAAALHRRRFGLAELDSECLSDPAILRTAARVEHRADPKSLFPRAYSGGVSIRLKSGEVYERYEPVNRGAGDRALSEAEVIDKFMENALLSMTQDKARALRARVLDLENHSARDLLNDLVG